MTTKRRKPDERGVASVEFAIVSLLLMLFLFGIITFGFVFGLVHNLTYSAAEGARAAVGAVSDPPLYANVQQVAHDTAVARLDAGSPRTYGTVATVVGACDGNAAHTCITVTVSYPYAAHPIIPPLLGMAGIFPDVITRSSTIELS